MGVDRRRFAGNQFGQVDPQTRFWAYVDKRSPEECWPWLASTSDAGYGAFSVGKRYINAHRFAYESIIGPIPDGLTLDHRCRNRACVNPAHLEPVSRGENTLRGKTITAANRAKTHCPKGHEYTPENTYNWSNRRVCKTCHKAKTAAQRVRWQDKTSLPS
ncbi:MAG TPA: HNH endonuclease signature motif containing protein [Candidatus Paceibacterota bacterium]